MDSLPEQPENDKENQRAIITPLQFLKQHMLTPQDPTVSSLGEFLLPTLSAAMEACWIDAIFIGLASLHFLGSYEPLMPLWAPFILIAGSQWLFLYLERRAVHQASSSQEGSHQKDVTLDTSLFVILIAVISLFLIWQRLYAQTAFVLDPRWILTLLNDILLLNINFYQVVGLVGLSFLFGWRGIRLSQREIEPYHVFQVLCLGLGVIIVVVILRAGQASAGVPFHYEIALLLLIPIFLVLALAAHALARISFVRRTHPSGLQGSVVIQERAVMMVIGSIGIILLLIALLLASAISPAFLTDILRALAPLGVAYDWLVRVFAEIATILITPFFLLVTWLYSFISNKRPPARQSSGPVTNRKFAPPNSTPSPVLVLAIKILLPILFLVAVYFLVRWALRRRGRIHIAINRRTGDVHESLWSWSLFWTQFKAFLRALLLRFFPHRASEEEEKIIQEEINGELTARTMREIYRALLKKSASHGYARKKDETPYEFRQRLDEKVPLVEPQLEVITEAYTLTRYGGNVPDEAEVTHVRNVWTELDQKWAGDSR